ncbi:Protein CBG27885 [Caenorhabditis briggsae]|uniref:Protein CBG27885 n=1 Tax=Caenorhabditis briggsae TaxID=6238 RepID=B6IEI0_CAEBR|nr:Protein CBG27885 [Caenorhabditis briggsae]CAR98310.1 Protein CBG27885 [Caenorhabditis briggsae]
MERVFRGYQRFLEAIRTKNDEF